MRVRNHFFHSIFLTFLSIGLSGRRGIVIACVFPSIHLSVCLSVRLFVNFIFCTRHSSQIWAGITKFAPNMHPGIISAGIENRVINLDLQGNLGLRILANMACLCDYLKWIWVRMINFASNKHFGIFSTVVENEDHWSWLLMSFGPRNGIPRCFCILI